MPGVAAADARTANTSKGTGSGCGLETFEIQDGWTADESCVRGNGRWRHSNRWHGDIPSHGSHLRDGS